jgi:putative ABC transport system substrate-binding protein
MKRRELILLLGGAMTAPRALCGQQKAMPVIGFLGSTLPDLFAPFVAAFHRGLSEAGYIEGQNVAIECRWAEDHKDRLPALAVDLVARKVDLIVTSGGSPPVRAAKAATSTIPIFFIGVADPVATGLVSSLARPGGSITGFSNMSGALTPKRLELLSELIPQAKIVALLINPNAPDNEPMLRDVQEGARTRGLQLHILKAGTEGEIDAVSQRLYNCEWARSSSIPIHFSTAGASSS